MHLLGTHVAAMLLSGSMGHIASHRRRATVIPRALILLTNLDAFRRENLFQRDVNLVQNLPDTHQKGT